MKERRWLRAVGCVGGEGRGRRERLMGVEAGRWRRADVGSLWVGGGGGWM